MPTLSNKGAQPKTPQELLDSFKAELIQQDQSFLDLPQSLQGMLLQQASVYLSYVENKVSRMFNYPMLFNDNGSLFDYLGAMHSIRRKGAYKSEVTLKFSGQQGAIIPQGLRISNTEGSVVFETLEQAFIPSSGSIFVLAFCDADQIPDIGVGGLNKIIDNIPNLAVANINAPSAPQQEESRESYRLRVLRAMRNTHAGSLGKLLTYITNIEGVDTRLVSPYFIEKQDNSRIRQCLNLVIGGGDPKQIALALYNHGGLNPAYFQSVPSNGESSRTISQTLNVYNQSLTYAWTAPKKLPLKIEVRVALVKVEASNPSIEALTRESMQEFINSLKVGVSPNVASLTSAFMKGFRLAGGTDLNLNKDSITFTLTQNSQPINKDQNGFFNVRFDEYLELRDYAVRINE